MLDEVDIARLVAAFVPLFGSLVSQAAVMSMAAIEFDASDDATRDAMLRLLSDRNRTSVVFGDTRRPDGLLGNGSHIAYVHTPPGGLKSQFIAVLREENTLKLRVLVTCRGALEGLVAATIARGLYNVTEVVGPLYTPLIAQGLARIRDESDQAHPELRSADAHQFIVDVGGEQKAIPRSGKVFISEDWGAYRGGWLKYEFKADGSAVTIWSVPGSIGAPELINVTTKLLADHARTFLPATAQGAGWKVGRTIEPPVGHVLSEQQQRVHDRVQRFAEELDRPIEPLLAMIPRRLSLLVSGRPGCGKSTMVNILASKFGFSVFNFVIDATVVTNTVLLERMRAIPRRSLVLFEDLDRINLAAPNCTVTLDGLLNVIQGVETPSDIIIWITANNPENLSAALRSRCVPEEFGSATAAQQESFIRALAQVRWHVDAEAAWQAYIGDPRIVALQARMTLRAMTLAASNLEASLEEFVVSMTIQLPPGQV